MLIFVAFLQGIFNPMSQPGVSFKMRPVVLGMPQRRFITLTTTPPPAGVVMLASLLALEVSGALRLVRYLMMARTKVKDSQIDGHAAAN